MSSELDLLLASHADFGKASRLRSLYSDFAGLKKTNPTGFAANTRAWIDALNRTALRSSSAVRSSPDEDGPSQATSENLPDRCCITATPAMADLFMHSQWGRPLAFAAVEEEAVWRRDWVLLEEYLRGVPEGVSAGGVGSGGLSGSSASGETSGTSMLTSLFARLWGGGSSSSAASTGEIKPTLFSGKTYVIPANVRACADTALIRMQAKAASYTDHVFTREAFVAQLAKTSKLALTQRDGDVIIAYLWRDKRAIGISSDASTIKLLPATSRSPAAAHSAREVGPTDVQVATVKAAVAHLTSQCVWLEEKMAGYDAEARNAVRAGRKALAVAAIRARRKCDLLAGTWRDRRDQADLVLLKIDDAAQQVGLVKALESGAAALKSVLHDLGDLDKIDQLADTLRDQMDKVDDVNQAIASISDPASSAGASLIDDDALEREFQALSQNQESEHQKPSKEDVPLPAMPEAPITEIKSPQVEPQERQAEPAT
ncbi:hypothetical protein PYCC9005_003664 [Savitreella phatthalungensis]